MTGTELWFLKCKFTHAFQCLFNNLMTITDYGHNPFRSAFLQIADDHFDHGHVSDFMYYLW